MPLKSSSWRARDRRVLWHPFTFQSLWETEEFPVIERGQGSWLIDVDGRKYLDGVSSLWCNLLGHRRKEIDAALTAQIGKLSHATFLGTTNPPAVELAEKLVELAPRGLERVFYSDNGSTAVEVALKMAFQYWRQNGRPKRTKFVSLDQAYHGDTVGAMSAGAIDLYLAQYRPLMFETLHTPTTYAYRCPKSPCGDHCLADLERTLKQNRAEIAGVIIEPLIQGAGGMIVQPPGFVRAVRALCTKYDTFMIADEVMTGFGRTGTMFACDREKVTPDFLCLSKGLTGGYLPLAATLTTKRVFEGFIGSIQEGRTFYHGHTYTGNPLACAGALAVLEFLEKDRTLDKLKPKVCTFHQRLGALRDRDIVGDVRLCGLIAGIEMVKDKATKESFPPEARFGHRTILKARDHGVLLRPLGNTLVVMPPLTISDRELDLLLGVVEEILP